MAEPKQDYLHHIVARCLLDRTSAGRSTIVWRPRMVVCAIMRHISEQDKDLRKIKWQGVTEEGVYYYGSVSPGYISAESIRPYTR